MMIQVPGAVVISDTDILVHLVRSGAFEQVIPKVLKQVMIPLKVEEELKRSFQDVYAYLRPLLEQGDTMIRGTTLFKAAAKEQKIAINQTKDRMRAQLDPGELDCYAYSVGLQIDAIISNDKGAKRMIEGDSKGLKVVLSFADLFIMGAIKDVLPWNDAGRLYEQVVKKCNLTMPPFERQMASFEQSVQQHAWVQTFLNI